MTRIYLDHAASSPLRPEAREAMAAVAGEVGNASSLHVFGRRALQVVDEAREAVARALGGEFAEVVFTAGGTEAANLALVGTALAHEGKRRRILASAVEHHCVLHAAPLLGRLGFQMETVPVDRQARVDLDALERAMGDDVLMVALQHANNELGTRQPVEEAATLARRHGALLFCDAVQTFAAEPWIVGDLCADLVGLSAHKFGGPLGVGALWVRGGVSIQPVVRGGAQERERRAGTENWMSLAGLPAALAAVRPCEESERKARCRRAFLESLPVEPAVSMTPMESRATPVSGVSQGSNARPEGPWNGALSGHLHLRFPGISAESLLMVLDRFGVAAGSGAACSSGAIEPSHVLRACGYSEAESQEGVRFTFGWNSCEEQAVEAGRRTGRAVAQILASRTGRYIQGE